MIIVICGKWWRRYWYLKGIKIWKASEMRESAGIYCRNSELSLSAIPESDRMSSSFVGWWVSKLWLMLYTPSLIWPWLPQKILLTFRLLMSYIYMEHLFLMFLDHTQRRTTVGRTPLDEWSSRRRDLYLTTHDTHNRQISMPPVGFDPTISAGERPEAARLLRLWVRIPPGA